MKENVADSERLGDRIIGIELVLRKRDTHYKCIRVPSRIGEIKIRKNLEDLWIIIHGKPIGDKLIIGGFLNGHIGRSNSIYEQMNGVWVWC